MIVYGIILVLVLYLYASGLLAIFSRFLSLIKLPDADFLQSIMCLDGMSYKPTVTDIAVGSIGQFGNFLPVQGKGIVGVLKESFLIEILSINNQFHAFILRFSYIIPCNGISGRAGYCNSSFGSSYAVDRGVLIYLKVFVKDSRWLYPLRPAD